MHRYLPEGAGHKLHMNAPPVQLGKQFFEFAKSHQRVASYQRHMQRPMLLNQAQHALHQVAAFVVCELTQRDARQAQVPFLVGIAPRTTQRTLARAFDRNRWCPAGENGSPCSQYFRCLHDFSWLITGWTKSVAIGCGPRATSCVTVSY